MKNLLHKAMLLLALCLCSSLLKAQDSPPIYKEILVEFISEEDIENVSKLGVDFDHFHPQVGKSKLIVSEFSLDILQEYGYQFDIIDEDVAKSTEERNIKDLADYIPGSQEKTTNGFTLGSMGGFYTYAEIVQKLDEMKTLYPNLITAKENIGTSIEGRTIWAVKISDNPDTDESSTEAAVYYDALHHAREPASMAVVINYMFHLLENYGTDPEVTYLVDNREIFIVPIVNPDGYVYNQTTNPNGGGMWRKNRRNNSGSSCDGVDPNRNYDTDWSSPSGSSGNPCSDSYRGTAPFSEPETQAIRDYTTAIGAPAAYTLHTFGGYYLGPDFSNGQQEFAIHAEINNDCLDENEYIYGDADILLGYASGTTQNWMYETLGSLSWTPEIGTVSFWAPVNDIIPLVNEHVRPMQYLTWIVGALADYQGFTVLNSQGLSSAENLLLNIELKNKGLSQTAENVSVTITTDNPDVTAVVGTQAYPNIVSRAEAVNATPFEFSVAPSVAPGTSVQFTVQVSQDGVVSNSDTFIIPVGERNVLFSDNAEGGSGNWSNSGSGTTWQSSDEDAYTGNNCFVDSRLGHTASNNNRAFTQNSAVSLAGTSNPRLEFAAKWGLYGTSDFVRLQISVNGGGWTSLSTPAMEGANAYFGNETWTFESIDLSAYVGQSVRFRFWSISGSSLRSDGFYFDDFTIADYSQAPTCSDGIQNGNETDVDCGGPDCPACPTCSDGIQNGNETGVDCGGPDCPACPTCSDGIQNGDETGIDCGGSSCPACPTCSDGIQNGDETGVDCGGSSCPACVTCDDGIQNGNETGVDCGGPDCPACPTCSDGIQNGNETGVDCGGPDCPACVTCDDGIQNGNETGVDCGGPDCPACPTCSDGIQNGNETGVDCGGPDCPACPTCSDGIQNGNETGVDCGGPDCPACPTCFDGIQNGDETGVDCGGSSCPACPTCSDGIQNGDETGIDCGGSSCPACPTPPLAIEYGVATNVGEGWETIDLQFNYTSMVVVANIILPNSSTQPAVTRIDNATSGNSFNLRIQVPAGSASTTYDVHYFVVEEGVYTQASNGVTMEAVKVNSTVTAENNNWVIEPRSYQQGYANPVVLGQVMTSNDPDWSVFWASSATSRTNPPSSTSFGAGLNVGEDPDNTRASETIGYVVIEAGNGAVNGINYATGLGADIVQGPQNTSVGYTYGISGISSTGAAVLSAAAIDGNNGGWPVLYGGNPFTTSQITMVFDEDQAGDTERSHTTEQVAYIVFDGTLNPPSCTDGIQNGNETGVDCGGPDCPACPTCFDGIQNGDETGIDCGGSSCPACPTCSDGIQNGNETGVDCGGPDCPACPTCSDGIQNGNETGVDCGGPDCPACTSCSDGIQNGNETGVDCGGPDCPACPTCSDGIQNGNETGIDCGGPDCPACPTCSDGIQNGNETDVDCGGPDCPACPTCSDGIQNGNETDVDCGGPDCPACPTCSDGIQNGNETGLDCGGPDCPACPVNYCPSSANSTFYEYINSVSFGGQTNTSGDDGGYGDYTGLTPFSATAGASLSISLQPGFNGSAYREYWNIWIDYNQDGDFTDAGELVFQANSTSTINSSFTIPASANTGLTRMRIQMQYNQYYGSSCGTFAEGEVEDYNINIASSLAKGSSQDKALEVIDLDELLIAPNPVVDRLQVSFLHGDTLPQEAVIQVYDMNGRLIKTLMIEERGISTYFLDVSDLAAGLYLLVLQTEKDSQTARFIRQ